jgi:ABC-2 type transport system permease protein
MTMGAIEFFNRGLRDRKRALIGWSLGFVIYIGINLASFPSVEGSDEIDKVVQDYPDTLKRLFGISGIDLSSGPGYLDSQLFNLVLPLLAIVLAIGSGSKTLAGEEEDGRLELTFSYPVRWRDGVLAKGIASALEVAVVCAVSFVAIALLGAAVGTGVGMERLAGALLGIALIGGLHGMLALTVGAARPGRALAMAVPAAFAAFGYLVNGLYAQASWLEPFRFLSSFWWLGQSPLSTGVGYDRFLVVAVAAIAALVAAALLIERRDLQVP